MTKEQAIAKQVKDVLVRVPWMRDIKPTLEEIANDNPEYVEKVDCVRGYIDTNVDIRIWVVAERRLPEWMLGRTYLYAGKVYHSGVEIKNGV